MMNKEQLLKAQVLLLDENVSLSSVPYVLGYIHREEFDRDFKEETGITPAQFCHSPAQLKYKNIDMDRVVELVIARKKTLKIIAEDVGFSNVPSLVNHFKKYTGQSPAEYLEVLALAEKQCRLRVDHKPILERNTGAYQKTIPTEVVHYCTHDSETVRGNEILNLSFKGPII